MPEKYDCCTSEFDIKKHKETYVNYFEALMLENGKIVYAIPSHQVKLEQITADILHITVDELRNKCPKDYYFDYLSWLLNQTNTVALWTDFYKKGNQPLTTKQIAKLKILKLNGIYIGTI